MGRVVVYGLKLAAELLVEAECVAESPLTDRDLEVSLERALLAPWRIAEARPFLQDGAYFLRARAERVKRKSEPVGSRGGFRVGFEFSSGNAFGLLDTGPR